MELKTEKTLDSPDNLQDLCVFYLMNNLDSLVASLDRINASSGDVTASFSLLLGNRLLDYYTRFCLPLEDDQKNFDKLLEKGQLFDEIDIFRSEVFTKENIRKLAKVCKTLSKLHVTCFEDDAFFTQKYKGIEKLIENTLPNLSSLSLVQKCEERVMINVLEYVSGTRLTTLSDEKSEDGSESTPQYGSDTSDNNDDPVTPKDVIDIFEDSGSDSLKLAASDDRYSNSSEEWRAQSKHSAGSKTAASSSSSSDSDENDDAKDNGNTMTGAVERRDESHKVTEENDKDKGHELRTDRMDKDIVSGNVEGNVCNEKYEGKCEPGATGSGEVMVKEASEIQTHLKAFSYNQVYTGAHPNCDPCHNYGWFYWLMSGILKCNKTLQSFSVTTLISNPIEWFLSRPDLAQLANLQSLCLSFQYISIYSACSEEIRYPKMPYDRDFFKNLPVLKLLRHLDVSCNLPCEDEDEDGEAFVYEDRHVEMFREAIKELPFLVSLDISGTNLSTIIGHTDKEETKCLDHCMPGFEGRKFDFLGLYGTDACKHKFIPARRISGNASIEQLVEALKTLQHNLLIIPTVVSEIFDWVKGHTIGSDMAIVVIDGLLSYLSKLGQWSGSYNEAITFEEGGVIKAIECIAHLLNDEAKTCMTIKRRRMLLEQILLVCNNVSDSRGWGASNTRQASKGKYLLRLYLSNHFDCNLTQGSGVVSLQDKIYTIVMQLIHDHNLQAVAIYSHRLKSYFKMLTGMFHASVDVDITVKHLEMIRQLCYKHPGYRDIVGSQCRMVKKLVSLLIDRQKGMIQPIEKISWEFLQYLTGGSFCNSEAFVENQGAKAVMCYIQKYHREKDLLYKVVAVLANVAEYPSTAEYLMDENLVKGIDHLTARDADYKRLSTYAVDFLVQMVLHGEDAWTLDDPEYLDVLGMIKFAMRNWAEGKRAKVALFDVETPFGRSLSTILQLLEDTSDSHERPVLQMWAAWKLNDFINCTLEDPKLSLDFGKILKAAESVLNLEGLPSELVTLLSNIKTLSSEQTVQDASG